MPGAMAGPRCAMSRKARPYVFLGQTTSMCETCLRLVPAKIIEADDAVWYQKRCAEHGVQRTLVSSDAPYWKRCRDFLKPGDLPLQFQTRIDKGCPYDCGLCPDHEQHSCLALIEINETCNLTCPTCFAGSSPALPGQLPLAVVERMLDTLVASESEPDLLQISGGEPTLHPELFAIIAAAKRRNIRHLMLNTNGIRIATEPDFAARLAECMPRFEVYLQFDALSRAALQTIRGADLRRTHARLSPISKRSACRPPSSPLCAKGSTTTRSVTSCAMPRSGVACAGSISSRCRIPGETRASCRIRTALY